MPPTPSQIREQLLKAIDQDAKVINMVCVLEAISCLENTSVTKEALEETRLGKIVNDIRKNTNDSSLSTRCKKLVRVWSKQFVRGTTSSGGGNTQDAAASNRQPTPPTQGKSKTPSLKSQASTTPVSSSTVDKNKSENRKRRKASTSPGAGSSLGSTPTSTKKLRQATSSTPTSQVAKDKTSSSETKNGMPAQREASASNLQSSKSAFTKVKPSDSKPPSRTSSPASKAKAASLSPGVSKPNASTSKALSKSPLAKQTSTSVNSLGGKVAVEPAKSGKSSPVVKSKQQTDSSTTSSLGTKKKTDQPLAAEKLQIKTTSTQRSLILDSNSSSATVKLRSPSTTTAVPVCGQTTCNYDKQPESPSIGSLSQEKDLPKTFSIFDDDYDEEDIHSGEKYVKVLEDSDKGVVALQPSVTETTQSDVPPRLSSTESEIVDIHICIEDRDLTAVRTETPVQVSIPSDHEMDEVPSKPATEEDLARIHKEHWSGVNGCYNHQNEWFDWTQTYSVPVQDDNALHILPYICLD